MKRNLIKVIGALSIGALALTGCKGGGDAEGDKTGSEQPAEGENKCPSGENKCPSGENKCPSGEKK
jgi:hypothetical protein